MTIELNGKMTGAQIKTQFEKMVTKDGGKTLCENLTTSFRDVENPICTKEALSDMTAKHWASMLVLFMYIQHRFKSGEYDRNASLPCVFDAFKKCEKNVGRILFQVAQMLQNNFSIFPLSRISNYNTWDEIFDSKDAIDDICSFYPLFALVGHIYGQRLAQAAVAYNSKLYCIKDGWYWNSSNINCHMDVLRMDVGEIGIANNGYVRMPGSFTFRNFRAGWKYPDISSLYFHSDFITSVVREYCDIYVNIDFLFVKTRYNPNCRLRVMCDHISPTSSMEAGLSIDIKLSQSPYTVSITGDNVNETISFNTTSAKCIVQNALIKDGWIRYISPDTGGKQTNAQVMDFRNLYFTFGDKEKNKWRLKYTMA